MSKLRTPTLRDRRRFRRPGTLDVAGSKTAVRVTGTLGTRPRALIKPALIPYLRSHGCSPEYSKASVREFCLYSRPAARPVRSRPPVELGRTPAKDPLLKLLPTSVRLDHHHACVGAAQPCYSLVVKRRTQRLLAAWFRCNLDKDLSQLQCFASSSVERNTSAPRCHIKLPSSTEEQGQALHWKSLLPGTNPPFRPPLKEDRRAWALARPTVAPFGP